MPPAPSQRPRPGFTLIELMVVILIIGITINFAVLSLRGSDPKDLLEKQAKRLLTMLQLASQQAILRGTVLGLRVDPEGYRFLSYRDNHWSATADPYLKETTLDEGMRIQGTVDGEPLDRVLNMEEKKGKENAPLPTPQIWILNTGEMTPFELLLVSDEVPESGYAVVGTETGNLTLEQRDVH